MTSDTTTPCKDRPLTFRAVLLASDEDHDTAVTLAFVALGAATGCSPRAAQRLLDSPVGAGLGATVVRLCDGEGLALPLAIVAALRRQQDWDFGPRDARAHGIDARLPYLTGWLGLLDSTEDDLDDDGEAIDDASLVPHHPAWRRAMGEEAPALPPGIAEGFRRIERYGFVTALWPAADEAELVALAFGATLAIAHETGFTSELALAFLRDMTTGQAFGEAMRMHLLLDPAGGVTAALTATINDWKICALNPSAASRFGAEPGMPRLAALAAWHAREKAEDGEEDR